MNATISDVIIKTTGRDTYITLKTKEYDDNIHISTTISKNISIEKIKNLLTNETIIFRVQQNNLNTLNTGNFVNIVSLKTENETIFIKTGDGSMS